MKPARRELTFTSKPALQRVCKFREPAERIRELHLSWSPTLELENAWSRHKDGNTLCSGSRDIQAVETVEELHPPRGVRVRRRRERVDRNRGLLTLKLVHGPYESTRQPLLDFEDLSVVRSDYEDIFRADLLCTML